MSVGKSLIVSSLCLFQFVFSVVGEMDRLEVWRAESKPLHLIPVAQLEDHSVFENSGLALSAKVGNSFWTHNDSSDLPRVLRFRWDWKESSVQPKLTGSLFLEGVINRDWEDIWIDGNGRIFVADTGNNLKLDVNYAIHVLEESREDEFVSSTEVKTIRFRYEVGCTSTTAEVEKDCEAIFGYGSHLILFTKRMLEDVSDVYVLEHALALDNYRQELIAKHLGQVAGLGPVTAADSFEGGKRIAILSYDAVWLFYPKSADSLKQLLNEPHHLNVRGGLIEGICFINGENLLISNEANKLFVVPVDELVTGDN